MSTPVQKKQPDEEKPSGFTAEDHQGDLIAEMKLNDELTGELHALEGRRRLVLMDSALLYSIQSIQP